VLVGELADGLAAWHDRELIADRAVAWDIALRR
jgi:hypothetical protein